MLSKLLTAIACAAALVVCSLHADTAFAQSVDMEQYDRVKEMATSLTTMRHQLEDFAYEAATDKRKIDDAEKELGRMSPGSQDYVIAEERLRSVKREALDHAMAKLSAMTPVYQKSQEQAASSLKQMIKKPEQFQLMVKGHLKGEANAVVLGTVVYLATKRLNLKAQELHAKAVMGVLEFDLEDLSLTMNVVDDILAGQSGGSMDIDEVMKDLTEGSGLAMDGDDQAIDELDEFLK